MIRFQQCIKQETSTNKAKAQRIKAPKRNESAKAAFFALFFA
jgi:hypothetical protein